MIPDRLISILRGTVVVGKEGVTVIKAEQLREEVIDKLVYEAVFGSNLVRPAARWLVWEIAQELGVFPSSIQSLYTARGRGVVASTFTTPAMNFRGLAYDTSRALFATAIKMKAKAFICELARGEMGYTKQSPMEYTTAMLAGAIKEGFEGPVFIQGDHFQTKCSKTAGIPVEGELEALVALVQEALEAGFLNIDIDASTLVDLSEKLIKDQQLANIHYTAELLKLIRSLEPGGVTVSVGGEIGHIGGKNSTPEEFRVFMDGLMKECGDETLISKISIATGTSHGGVVNPDGTMAEVAVDFDLLEKITKIGQREYGIAGAVQHGASTLPDSMLHRFVEVGAAEIHLATGFQNYLMDDAAFPKELLGQMYDWLDETQQKEREEGRTDEQFHYRLRKKCWGKFKKEVWDLPESNRKTLREMLMERFELIFRELNIEGTDEAVAEHTPNTPIHKEITDFVEKDNQPEVSGLSD